MRIVIPTDGSVDTLPWALASIRHHTELEPLTIGPLDPGLCEHWTVHETGGAKERYAHEVACLRLAVDRLASPFVWSSDDIYWLKPAAPIMWAIGDLHDHASRLIRQRKAETAATLTRMGLPTFDYESHVPMPVDPDVMFQALDIVAANPNVIKPRSIYGNLHGQPDRVAPDVKLRNPDNRHRNVEWASTQGDPMRYPHLAGMLTFGRQ